VPQRRRIGWREWLTLPELGIERIKAKVDTGARTSALHAFRLERETCAGAPWVRIWLHPLQRDTATVVECAAAVIDEREVRDSGGHTERRPVIETPVTLGGLTWAVEMTLTSREDMLFRMLLGRTAMRSRFLVDPGRSYLQSEASEG